MSEGTSETGTVVQQEQDHRGGFHYEVGGKRLASMTYSRAGAALIIIDHTEVDKQLSGQGIGRKLLDTLVAWARETNTKVMATCPFALAQFGKDPSIRDVLS